MKVLVTGSAGFVCGYLVEELLNNGHTVVGIDNFSKYGPIKKSYDNHPRYEFCLGDAKNLGLMKELIVDCDAVLAAAAAVGGVPYLNANTYSLLAENERITASVFDAAIWAFTNKKLKKINVISSSVVYESSQTFPSVEGDERKCPPPASSYGFQKLATEYYCRSAWEQFKLPFTIIRLFNCVGTGEKQALLDGGGGNFKLATSHVVPDLIQKILKGQNPLRILGDGSQIRSYTYAGDLARGIRLCIEKDEAVNEDFNLSTPVSTTVLELAKTIWKKLLPDQPFKYVSDQAFKHDVQKSIPSVQKAKDLLGFSADTSLDAILDEVIPWIIKQEKAEKAGI
jgi:nucleoside-diphosphate-sugar epimerase